MKNKNIVMVIDAGGRGAALVDAYSKSPFVSKILAVPGNDLMQINSKKKVITFPNLKTTSVEEIVKIAKKYKVDLVDVAQDNAVAYGVSNALQNEGIATIGPTKEAGQIEWDKSWSRDFMKKYKIPIPSFYVFNSEKEGIEFLNKQKDQPWFVKASGLAEGKGALPARNRKEAIAQIKTLKQFGDSGKIYLIEQWLIGEEFSFFVLTDGKTIKVVGSAQDHKRMYSSDLGQNTGGMGCVSQPMIVTKDIEFQANKIVRKAIDGLAKEGRIYKGVLYLGGIVVKEGGKQKVYVIEFNARWGSPEAEVLVLGITNDLYKVGLAVANEKLKSIRLKSDKKARIVIAGALHESFDPSKKRRIYGIEKVIKMKGIKFYGTRIYKEKKKMFAGSGRLFQLVAEGKNIQDAREKAYAALSNIYIENNSLHFRIDIGFRDVERRNRYLSS